jgi:cytochrome c551/c552
MKKANTQIWLAILGMSIAINLRAGPLKIELPAESGVFPPGTGVELANGQCLVCHSVEYIATQPPLPGTFWTAEVKKMREKYGAAIPEEQVEPLLAYLVSHFSTDRTNSQPAVVADNPVAIPMNLPAPNAVAIATKYGCLGCHNVTVKIVGPSYHAIADKYRHDTDAAAKVREQIQKGGSGKWGPIIMPPFPQIGAVETKALTDWILGQD